MLHQGPNDKLSSRASEHSDALRYTNRSSEITRGESMRRQVDSASESECRAGTLQQAPSIACDALSVR